LSEISRALAEKLEHLYKLGLVDNSTCKTGAYNAVQLLCTCYAIARLLHDTGIISGPTC